MNAYKCVCKPHGLLDARKVNLAILALLLMNMEQHPVVTPQQQKQMAEAASQLSGRAFLERMVEGDLPQAPIALLLGFALTEVGDGTVVFEVLPRTDHYHPMGAVHGGFTATLLDSAMACAIQTRLPAGTTYTTLEIKINYVRTITAETGLLYARGKTVHVGRKTATAEAQLQSEAGKLFAFGTTTCIIL